MRSSDQIGIEVRNLTFGYTASHLFLDFDLAATTPITVIQGYSGCGKTTLLFLLAGHLTPLAPALLPPSDSSVLLLQEDGLVPWLTGHENIFRIAHLRPEDVETNPIFASVQSYMNRSVATLSFGQRRLIELLRATSSQRAFLYLDEPFNYLDDDNAQLAWEAIKHASLVARAIVISTHHHREMLIRDSVTLLNFRGSPPWRALHK